MSEKYMVWFNGDATEEEGFCNEGEIYDSVEGATEVLKECAHFGGISTDYYKVYKLVEVPND